jgi:hypothetical protein
MGGSATASAIQQPMTSHGHRTTTSPSHPKTPPVPEGFVVCVRGDPDASVGRRIGGPDRAQVAVGCDSIGTPLPMTRGSGKNRESNSIIEISLSTFDETRSSDETG